MSRSIFKHRVLAGDVLVGSFVNLGSALTAEVMGVAGFDWLVIDLEHGAGDEATALAQVQTLKHTGAAAVVRVERGDRARIGHALDAGAAGVLVPRVDTVDDARQAAACCRYEQQRGIARQIRGWEWGLDPGELAAADADVLCAIQIETAPALDAAAEIAAIDGVDVLFVGPNDLAHALGIAGGPTEPALLDRSSAVAAAAREHGKAAGVLVRTPEQAAAYRDLGFTVIGASSDGGLLAEAARSTAAALAELR